MVRASEPSSWQELHESLQTHGLHELTGANKVMVIAEHTRMGVNPLAKNNDTSTNGALYIDGILVAIVDMHELP